MDLEESGKSELKYIFEKKEIKESINFLSCCPSALHYVWKKLSNWIEPLIVTIYSNVWLSAKYIW